MNLKANVGVCRKLRKCNNKMVIIPKDPEIFKDNDFVVIMGSEEFTNFTKDINNLIKLMESIKEETKEE